MVKEKTSINTYKKIRGKRPPAGSKARKKTNKKLEKSVIINISAVKLKRCRGCLIKLNILIKDSVSPTA